MDLNNIKKYINNIISFNEVLSKSELKDVLPELNFGIEIEMEHDGNISFREFKRRYESSGEDKYDLIDVSEWSDFYMEDDTYYYRFPEPALLEVLNPQGDGTYELQTVDLSDEYTDNDEGDEVSYRDYYDQLEYSDDQVFEDVLDNNLLNGTRTYFVTEKDNKWNELYELTQDWEVHYDGSLNETGVEIVSPPMPYEDFITKIPQVVSILKDIGYYGNDRTGLHIGVSSNTVNLSDKLENDWDFYNNLYGSETIATVLAYNIDSKGLFAQGEVARQESEYSDDLINFLYLDEVGLKAYIEKRGFSSGVTIEDPFDKEQLKKLPDFTKITFDEFVENADIFINGADKFKKRVDQNIHKVSMTRREDYIELRGLGGQEAFDKLQDINFVKRLCIIIASQVTREPKEYSKKELFKILRPYFKDLLPALFQTADNPKESPAQYYREEIEDYLSKKPTVFERLRNNQYIHNLINYLNHQDKVNKAGLYFFKYPIDVTYVYFKNLEKLSSLNTLIFRNIFKTLDEISKLPNPENATVAGLLGMYLKKHVDLIPKDIYNNLVIKLFDILDTYKSTSYKIFDFLPAVNDNILKYMFLNGQEGNSKFHAFKTLADSGKLTTLPQDQLMKFLLGQVDKGYSVGVTSYLNNPEYESILNKLVSTRPEIIKNIPLPTEDILNIALDKIPNDIPYSTWFRTVNSEAIKGNEKYKDLFVRLGVMNPSYLQYIDYIEKPLQLEIVKQRPDAILYLKTPYGEVLQTVRDLKGGVGDKWIQTAAKDFGYPADGEGIRF